MLFVFYFLSLTHFSFFFFQRQVKISLIKITIPKIKKKHQKNKSQPRKIQFLPTSCWLNFSAPIFFVWLLHIFARTQTKETPSDLCTFDLAIGLFVFLGYFFFLFLLISPHCGYFFFLLSLGSWVFMVNFPSKWMLFCLHSNS